MSRSDRARTKRGILWAVAGALLAAGYLIPYKVAAGLAGAEAVALPLLLVAAVVNTMVTGLDRRRPWRLPDRTSLWVALVFGFCAAVGNEAGAQSLSRIGPGLASVMLRTQVLWVALGGMWILGERVGRRFWAGAGVAMLGLVLMQGGMSPAPESAATGMVWALIAALAFAGIQLTVRRTVHRIDVLQVNALRLWFSVAMLALVPGRVEGLLGLGGRAWLLTAAAAVAGPLASRLCLMESLRTIPAALSTLVLFTGPVFAYGLGGLVFGVWPGPLELAGSAVILGGIAVPVLETLRRGGERPKCSPA